MGETDCSRVFVVRNKLGLHARAGSVFVRVAAKFESDVTILKDGFEVNGKSILGVLSLGAINGSEIKVFTRGDDAEEALDKIGELIDSGFGEGI